MQLFQLPLRGAQFLFCIPVLGMTVWLVKTHGVYGLASITIYVLFCAIFGLLTSIVGTIAAFTTALQGLAILVIDAFSVLFFLAGSIALAVQTGVSSCDPGLQSDGDRDDLMPYRLWHPGMISNGYNAQDTEVGWYGTYGQFVTRCRLSQANDAFLFFALAAFIASLALDVLSGRKGKNVSI